MKNKKFLPIGTSLLLVVSSLFFACPTDSDSGGVGGVQYVERPQSSEAALIEVGGSTLTPESGDGTSASPFVYGQVTVYSDQLSVNANAGGNVKVSPYATAALYEDSAFTAEVSGNVYTGSGADLYIKVTSEDRTATTYHKVPVVISKNPVGDAQSLARSLGGYATAAGSVVTIVEPGIILHPVRVPVGVTLELKAPFTVRGTTLRIDGDITDLSTNLLTTESGGKIEVTTDAAFATVLSEKEVDSITVAGDVSTYDRNSYIVSGRVTVDPGASLSVITNGEFLVRSGASVTLAGGTTLEALGNVLPSRSALGVSRSRLGDVIPAGGSIPGGKLAVSRGTLDIEGTIALESGASTTVVKTAVLNVAPAGNLTVAASGAAAKTELVVEGTLKMQGTARIDGDLKVAGKAEIAGALTVASGGIAAITGSGEFVVEASGKTVIAGAVTVSDTARVEVAAEAELKVENTGTVAVKGESELKIDAGGKADIAGNLTTDDGTKFDVAGEVEVETGAKAEIAGELATSEGAEIKADGEFKPSGEITGEGDSVISGEGADLAEVKGGEPWFTVPTTFKIKSVGGTSAQLSVWTTGESPSWVDERYTVSGNNLAILKAIYDPNAPGTQDDVSLDAASSPAFPKTAVTYTDNLSADVLNLFTFTTTEVSSAQAITKIELAGTPPTAATYGASNANIIVIDIGKPAADNSVLPTVYIPLDAEESVAARSKRGTLGTDNGTYGHVRLRVNKGASLVILADNKGYIDGGAGDSCPNGRFNGGAVEVLAGGKLRDGAYEGFPLGANAVILSRTGSYLAIGPEADSSDATDAKNDVYNMYYKGWLIGPDGSGDDKPRIKWDSTSPAAGFIEVRPGKLAISADVTVQKALGLIYSVWFLGDTTVTIEANGDDATVSGKKGLFANGPEYKFYGLAGTTIVVKSKSWLHTMYLTSGDTDAANGINDEGSDVTITNNQSGSPVEYAGGIIGYQSWTGYSGKSKSLTSEES